MNRYVVVAMVQGGSIMDTAHIGPFNDHHRAVRKAEQIERFVSGVTAMVADMHAVSTSTAGIAEELGLK